jgi:hypothetical protein
MAFNCPHCAKGIDSVIPKERLDEKIAQIATLTTEAKESKRKAAAYDALEPQWQEAQTKLAELPTLTEQITALKAEKVEAVFTAAGIANPKVRNLFQVEFDEQATAEDGVKDIGAFIAAEKAKEATARNPLLAPFLAATPPPVVTPPANGRPNVLPPPSPTPVVAPPAPGARMTPQQIATGLAEINARYAPAKMPADPTARAAAVVERNAAVQALQAAAKAPAAT